MSEEDPEVGGEAKEKPSRRTRLFKKLKETWTQLTFVATVLGTLVGGIVFVDDKIDEIEQRGVDLADLKNTTASIRAEQAAINLRITENVNKATKQITAEFQTRDHVDEELRRSILATLSEVRARHGVITLADPGGGTHPVRRRATRQEVEAAEAASDTASIRTGNALPQGDPLAGLDGL